MGSIFERKRADGSTGYTAQIIIKKGGKVVHNEAQTFDRRQAATAWMGKREAVLRAPGGLDKKQGGTLADAIDKYVHTSIRQIGKTKAQVLRSLKSHGIADKQCAEITSVDIVDLATELGRTRSPATVGNYLSHLGAIFAIAGPAWGYQLNEKAVRDAMKVSRRLGVSGKSIKRDRRPTLPELDKLMAHFQEAHRRRPHTVPMHVITAFAIFSTRRQEEITRIQRRDLDEVDSRIMVRDMKNPGEKIGNDVWCDLPARALAILKAQPDTGLEFFPYSTDAISAGFTRACKVLGIEDLHFHDLRHDGISCLAEQDMSIPRVAAVSGHRSWTSLKRYTHIRKAGDKYTEWKWLPMLVKSTEATAVVP